jgi:peptidoglycan/xylan/chitin deacetylase (PgdA/CDA1 family)
MKLAFAIALLVAFCGAVSVGAEESLPSAPLPILCYHRVLPHPESEYDLALADFHAQIDALQEKGFVTISLQEWAQALEGKTAFPDQPVILSFDDGSISAYEAVFPLLKAHNLKGTFFVSTGLVSNSPGAYLTWDQLKEMSGSGMEIMPHGHSHANLAKKAPGETEESYRTRVRKELAHSKSLLESSLHRPCPFFAYPYGAYNQEVEEMAKEVDFTFVLTACPGINTAQTNPNRLKRQIIYRDDKIEGFSHKLSASPLSAQFPFEEGAILDEPPNRIEIDLPQLDSTWNSPILLLDRKEVSASYDPAASRLTFVPGAPLHVGLHILEVRIIEKGSGYWHQDSTLFAVRPPQKGVRSKD